MRVVSALRGTGPSGPARHPESGFSLIEVVVAIGVIGTLMTSLSVFFVQSVSYLAHQRSRHAAIQVADGAVERVRSLPGPTLTEGRYRRTAEDLWSAPVPGAGPHLAGLAVAVDDAARPNSRPVLPFAESVRLNGVEYTRHIYLGTCWQGANASECSGTPLTDAGPLLRVVVAVTWPERTCAPALCSHVTQTLVSTQPDDALFNVNEEAGRPTLTHPGNQTSQAGAPVNLQVAASGGSPPYLWDFTGLPPGLTGGPTGLISGVVTGPPAGSVTVALTDAFGLVDQITFSWEVTANVAAPSLSSPGAQQTQVQQSVRLAIGVTGGTTPRAFTATGLPTGLSISGSTGTITGAPETVGTSTVTVTVTDARGMSSTVSFDWTVTNTATSSSYPQTVLVPEDPLGYWRLGEASGTVATDASGKNWHGTYIGTVGFGRPGAVTGDPDTAIFPAAMGGGADLGGVDLGDRESFVGFGRFSLEAWVRPTAQNTTTGNQTVIRKAAGTPASGTGYGLVLNPTDGFTLMRQSSAGTDWVKTGPVASDTWHHVAATFNDTEMKIYLNGVLRETKVSTISIEDNTASLQIGVSTGLSGSELSGDIDEVLIYENALYDFEVAEHYEKGANG